MDNLEKRATDKYDDADITSMGYEKAKGEYHLPVRKEDCLRIVREGSPAHKGDLKNAVDFAFAREGDFSVEGRDIYAATDGKVVHVKDDSMVGGPDKKFWNDGNRIVIAHGEGEFTAYEHLKKGALVKVGDKVRTGQLIGYSGNTGYTFGSHLHFEVFYLPNPKDKSKIKTLKVTFK